MTALSESDVVTPTVIAATALLFTLLALIWRFRFAQLWPAASSKSVDASRVLLICWLAVATVSIDRRSDLSSLWQSGLSTQNKVLAAVASVIILWSVVLMYKRIVRFEALLAGPMFWVSFLVLAFLASSLWSVWPELTFYRAGELAGLEIITIHVFARETWMQEIQRFIWIAVLLELVNSIYAFIFITPFDFFGARSNMGGPVAAALIVILLDEIGRRPRGRIVAQLTGVLVIFALFNSLASVLALLIGAPALYLMLPRNREGRMVAGLSVALGACIVIGASILIVEEKQAFLNWVAEIFNKQSDNLENATGRTEIWASMWEAIGSQPWGFGYVAGERLYASDASHAGFSAMSAHNGYLSALFGTGWTGLGTVIMFIWAIYGRTLRLMPRFRPCIQAVMLILSFNNFFIPGIGSQSNSAFLLAMAIACAPVAARRHERARALNYWTVPEGVQIHSGLKRFRPQIRRASHQAQRVVRGGN